MPQTRIEPTFSDELQLPDGSDPLVDDGLPHRAARRRVEKLSDFLDTKFRLPVVGFRFGWDSILGLIPGAGDAVTAFMGGYLIYEAWRAGAGGVLLARMIFNLAFDTIVGAVPLLGDVFDFAFRANLRNANLLRQHYAELNKRYRRPPPLE